MYKDTYFEICKIICNNMFTYIKERVRASVNVRVEDNILRIKIETRDGFNFIYEVNNFIENVLDGRFNTELIGAACLAQYKNAILKKYFKPLTTDY